jgi:hypothetical protein
MSISYRYYELYGPTGDYTIGPTPFIPMDTPHETVLQIARDWGRDRGWTWVWVGTPDGRAHQVMVDGSVPTDICLP